MKNIKSMEIPTLPFPWAILTKTSFAHNMPKKNYMRWQSKNCHNLVASGLAKVKEFLNLKFPRHVVGAACCYMAASTGEQPWLNLRDTI